MARLITISSRSATGFRRSGLRFTPEPQTFDCMAFSPRELDALLAEPALICVLSDEQLDLDPPPPEADDKVGSDDAAAPAEEEVDKTKPAGRGRRSAPAD